MTGGGQCSGLTAVWGLYEAEDIGALFTRALEDIATWDESLDSIDTRFMENFINSVKILQAPKTLLGIDIEQADYDKMVAMFGGMNGAFSRKEHRVDFVFKLDELANTIQKTIIANKKFVRVASTDHAVGVMLIDNHYWLYDPSDEEGRPPRRIAPKGKNGAQALARELQNLFLTKWNEVQTAKMSGKPGDENIPISLHTFDMPNSDRANFPEADKLIADIIDSRIHLGEPVNLQTWDSRDALWMLVRRGCPSSIKTLLKAMDQHFDFQNIFSHKSALEQAAKCNRENEVFLAFYPEYDTGVETIREKTLPDYEGQYPRVPRYRRNAGLIGVYADRDSEIERKFNALALQACHLTDEVALYNKLKTKIQDETRHELTPNNSEEKFNDLLARMDALRLDETTNLLAAAAIQEAPRPNQAARAAFNHKMAALEGLTPAYFIAKQSKLFKLSPAPTPALAQVYQEYNELQYQVLKLGLKIAVIEQGDPSCIELPTLKQHYANLQQIRHGQEKRIALAETEHQNEAKWTQLLLAVKNQDRPALERALQQHQYSRLILQQTQLIAQQFAPMLMDLLSDAQKPKGAILIQFNHAGAAAPDPAAAQASASRPDVQNKLSLG